MPAPGKEHPDLFASVPLTRRAFVRRLAGAAFVVPIVGSFGAQWAAASTSHHSPYPCEYGYAGGYLGGMKGCVDQLHQKKKDFEEQQKAEKKAFEATPHTKEEKQAFHEMQKAAKKAFHEQWEQDKEFCKTLPVCHV